MKVCLRAFQSEPYLEKADELKVIWDKRDIIPQILEKYPEKTVVLECPLEFLEDEDLKEVKMYYGLSRGKFKLCCYEGFENLGVPFYYGFPISDYFMLNAALQLENLTEVRIGGSLLFNIKEVSNLVKKYEKQIRVIPNVAYIDKIPKKEGVLGSYIRPEDLDLYEDYIDIIEFEDTEYNARREAALYRIYIEEKHWDGELQDLITNLNFPGLNRMIPRQISHHRVDCRQACLSKGSTCKLCYRMLELADPKMYEESEQLKNEIIYE